MSDRLRRENVEFFEDALRGHSAVTSFAKIDRQLYRVSRSTGPDMLVFLTNAYIVTEQFYYETRGQFVDIDAIVTLSAWNSYTKDAKQLASGDQVGIFVAREFLGALRWKQPWKYVKKDDEGNPVRFWRERASE